MRDVRGLNDKSTGEVRVNADKDIWAGLFFMALAALGLFIGWDYAFGTPARMGAGFLPKLLCWALFGLGGIIALTGLVRRGEGMDAWAWGELLAILSAVLLFGAALEVLGLEAAILGAVLIGGTGAPTPNRFERICLVVAAVTLSLFLMPGFGAKVNALTGAGVIHSTMGIIAVIASVIAVISHAQRVPLATMLERVLLGVGLGIICIIIFVDGLGLTMKSVVVMDVWNAVKSTIIRPVISLIFR